MGGIPVQWLLIIGAIGLLLATLPEISRSVAQHSGGSGARFVPLALASFVIAALLAWGAGVLPGWAATLGAVAWVIFAFAGNRILRPFRRASPVDGLARAFGEIVAAARRPSLTETEIASVATRSRYLDRYRSAETSPFIDLVQQEVAEWAAGTLDPETAAERRAKILELADQLFT